MHLRCPAKVAPVHASRPLFFHFLPFYGFGLAFGNPLLLEEDVAGVKDFVVASLVRAAHGAETRQLCALDLRALLWPVELAVEVASELCLGDTRVAKVSGDLATYVCASVVYGYFVVLFAV